MNAVDPALANFASKLAEIVSQRDTERMRKILGGWELPALGRESDPAEVVRTALALVDPAVSTSAADLLADVLVEDTIAVGNSEATLGSPRCRQLLEALTLAAELPARATLAAALRELLSRLRSWQPEDTKQLRLPLYRALSVHQVDRTLESEWLNILAEPSKDWTPARRTLLLVAWRGLLWVPPDPADLDPGQIVNLNRIENGLVALALTVDGKEGAHELLHSALGVLFETYQRSPRFWAEAFEKRSSAWQGSLQKAWKEHSRRFGMADLIPFAKPTVGGTSVDPQNGRFSSRPPSPSESSFSQELRRQSQLTFAFALTLLLAGTIGLGVCLAYISTSFGSGLLSAARLGILCLALIITSTIMRTGLRLLRRHQSLQDQATRHQVLLDHFSVKLTGEEILNLIETAPRQSQPKKKTRQ